MAGAPHHTVLSTAIGVEVLEDFAEMTGTEMVTIDADTTSRVVPARAALERRLPPSRRRDLNARACGVCRQASPAVSSRSAVVSDSMAASSRS